MTDLSRRGLPRLATAPGLHDARFSDARGSKAGGLEAGGHNARAGTSLTPYGMSFWALILAACGGGGGGGGPETAGSPAPEEEKFKNGGPVTVSSPTQLPGEQPPLEPPLEPPQSESRSGHVYDGPVKGARVYVDSDGDGELNTEKDHFVGTTDGQGWFTGSVPANLVGRRYIVDLNSATDLGDDGKEGGTGVNADRTLQGTWLAPEGASVVSALTHLIATGVMTKAQIQSAYPDFDPLVDNPYTQAAAALPPEKQQAFEKIRKALPTITRLVEENRDLINQNSDRLKGLETTIQRLEQKVAALQTKLAETLETPPSEPAENSPENPAPQASANTAPTGSNKVKSGVREDAPISFTANDFTAGARANDAGQSITHVVIIGLPSNGTLSLGGRAVTAGQEIAVSALPSLSYRSATNGHGANHGSFKFKLRDSGSDNNLSAEYTMRIDVAPVNDPATGAVAVTSGGGVVSGPVTTGTALSYRETTIIRDPDDPAASKSYQWQQQLPNGSWAHNRDATGASFTPTAPGTYRLQVTVTDGVSGDGSYRTIFHTPAVTVTAPPENPVVPPLPTNTAPTGSNKVKSGAREDAPISFTANDFIAGASANDAGQSITHIVIVNVPYDGALSFDGTVVTPLGREIAIDQISRLIYQSSPNGHGVNRGNFRFKLKDNGSDNNLSPTYTMRIDVAPENDPTVGAIAITSERSVVTAPVTTGSTLSYRQTTPIRDPDVAVLTLDHQWQRQVDGRWEDIAGAKNTSFTPNAAGIYRLQVTARDSEFGTNTPFHTPDVTVTAPVADPPRPGPDANPDAGPGTGPAVPNFVVIGGSDQATGQLVENVGAMTRQGEIDTGYAIGIAKRLLSKTYQADEVLDSTVVKFATGRSNNDTRFVLKSSGNHDGSSDYHYFQLYIKRGATFDFEEDAREEDAGNVDGKIAVTFTDRNGTLYTIDTDPHTDGDQPVLVALRNVDEKPTKMALDRSSQSLNEGDVTAPDGIKLATVNFEDSDRKAEFRNNEVEIRSINGVDLLDPDDHALFVIRNGNELWVKPGVTLNYERTAQFSNPLTGVNSGDHLSAYKIVLRHKTDDGGALPDQTFTLNINNVAEKPVVEVRDAATARPLPSGRLTEEHDTGITVKIYDPDSLFGNIQTVTPTVSDSDRFTLEEYRPILNRPGMPLLPAEPGVKYYRLVAKAGAQFAANESISLTISGTDDSAGNLTTTSPSFQLKVAAARVPTTPDTIGDGEIGVEGLVVDGGLRYFVIGPGKSLTAVVGGEVPLSALSYRWSYKPNDSTRWQTLHDETTKTITPSSEGLYRLSVAGKQFDFAVYRSGNEPEVPAEGASTTSVAPFVHRGVFHYLLTEGGQIGPVHDALAKILLYDNAARITNKGNAGENLPGDKTDVTITQMWSDGFWAYVQFTIDGRTETARLKLVGADADKFVLVVVNGDLRLMFRTLPDFEAPQDSGGNNVYDVSLKHEMPNARSRKVDLHLSIRDDLAENPRQYGTKTDNTLPSTEVDAAYLVTEGETTVQSLTAESLVALFKITLPEADSVQLRVLSDHRLLLEHSALGEESKKYVVELDGYRGWGHESLFRFIDRGFTGSGIELVDIQFLSAPDYENPIGGNAMLNVGVFRLKLVPVAGSAPSEIVKTVAVVVDNDTGDDVTVTTEGDVKTLSFPENGRTIAFISTTFEAGLSDVNVSNSNTKSPVERVVKVEAQKNGAAFQQFYDVTLEGNDAHHFSLKMGHDGLYIVFRQVPDYDDPDDRDGNNIYEVTYVVRDLAGTTVISRQKYKITITNDPSDDVPRSSGQAGGRSVVPLETEDSDGLTGVEELSLPMSDIA